MRRTSLRCLFFGHCWHTLTYLTRRVPYLRFCLRCGVAEPEA